MRSILVLWLGLISIFVHAQSMPPSVTVTGEGVVYAVPDEVSIRAGVQNQGKDAKAVKQENDAAVDKVLDFLVKLGIPQNQVQTQYISLNKNYDYNSKTYNYRASQTIVVQLKDLAKYESLMAGLLNSGINSIDGLEFSSSKIQDYEAEARKKAVWDAKKKAEAYAGVLGQSIGKALYISEQGTSRPQPQPSFKMALSESSQAGQNTLAPGELIVVSRIQISFSLND